MLEDHNSSKNTAMSLVWLVSFHAGVLSGCSNRLTHVMQTPFITTSFPNRETGDPLRVQTDLVLSYICY